MLYTIFLMCTEVICNLLISHLRVIKLQDCYLSAYAVCLSSLPIARRFSELIVAYHYQKVAQSLYENLQLSNHPFKIANCTCFPSSL